MFDLKQAITDVADFPRPGILFRDITPLLRDHFDRQERFAGTLESVALCGGEKTKPRRPLYSPIWQEDGCRIRRYAPIEFIGPYPAQTTA